MWRRFNPEFRQPSFPSPSISVAQVWSTVGHTCSMKEMEWGRTRGTHGGSYSVIPVTTEPDMTYGPMH